MSRYYICSPSNKNTRYCIPPTYHHVRMLHKRTFCIAPHRKSPTHRRRHAMLQVWQNSMLGPPICKHRYNIYYTCLVCMMHLARLLGCSTVYIYGSVRAFATVPGCLCLTLLKHIQYTRIDTLDAYWVTKLTHDTV